MTLAGDIRSGTYPAGTVLPSERSLAGHLGCTRHALRAVFDELEADGYLERRRGRGGGTVIRPRRIQRNLRRVASVPSTVATQGSSVHTEVQSIVQRATPRARSALHLNPDDAVLTITRTRFLPTGPYSLEQASFPAVRVPGLEHADLTGSLYSVLQERYGIVVAASTEELTATNATDRHAHNLHVSPGTALLSVVRVGFDDDGHPVEFSRDLFVGSAITATVSTDNHLAIRSSDRTPHIN